VKMMMMREREREREKDAPTVAEGSGVWVIGSCLRFTLPFLAGSPLVLWAIQVRYDPDPIGGLSLRIGPSPPLK